MSTKRIIYIAGPMTGKPEWNFPAFDRAAKELRTRGYTVVNPCDFDRARGFDPKTATEFSNKELREAMVAEFAGSLRLDQPDVFKTSRCYFGLADCTDLVLLDGWEYSNGAFAEASVAVWLGINVWTEESLDGPDWNPVFSVDELVNLREFLIEASDGILEMAASSTPEPHSILTEAQEIVEQRENQHGTFEDCLEDISKVWGTLLDQELTGAQVAICMAALKLVRGKQEYNRDNPLDLCGYAEGWNRWEAKYGTGNH